MSEQKSTHNLGDSLGHDFNNQSNLLQIPIIYNLETLLKNKKKLDKDIISHLKDWVLIYEKLILDWNLMDNYCYIEYMKDDKLISPKHYNECPAPSQCYTIIKNIKKKLDDYDV